MKISEQYSLASRINTYIFEFLNLDLTGRFPLSLCPKIISNAVLKAFLKNLFIGNDNTDF